jgi:hypothetical protein
MKRKYIILLSVIALLILAVIIFVFTHGNSSMDISIH